MTQSQWYFAKWGLLSNSRPDFPCTDSLFALQLLHSLPLSFKKTTFYIWTSLSGLLAAVRKELCNCLLGVNQHSVVRAVSLAKCEVHLLRHILACCDQFPHFKAWQQQRVLESYWQSSGTPANLWGERLILLTHFGEYLQEHLFWCLEQPHGQTHSQTVSIFQSPCRPPPITYIYFNDSI